VLSKARNFHYSSIVLAGISLAISSTDQPANFDLPLGNLVVPRPQAIVVIYILVLTFVLAADRMLSMARPWMKLDTRRPPFAWFILGTRGPNAQSIGFWLVFPVFVCALASANTVQIAGNSPFLTLILLLFSGVFAVLTPRAVYNYLDLIRDRRDHRGGRATFSIYLLLIYRLTTAILGTVMFICPVMFIVPAWLLTAAFVWAFVIATFGILYLIRLVAGFRFVYKRIDRYGVRYGFPAESTNYK